MKPFKPAYIPHSMWHTALKSFIAMLENSDESRNQICNLFRVSPKTSNEQLLVKFKQFYEHERQRSEVFINDEYQVAVYHDPPPFEGFPPIVHLSIRRLDRQAIHDWRDLQTIKNMLVGPESEGVELYPAESRLVDSANQYHLWCLSLNVKFPFGFQEGFILDHIEGSKSQQRPLPKNENQNVETTSH